MEEVSIKGAEGTIRTIASQGVEIFWKSFGEVPVGKMAVNPTDTVMFNSRLTRDYKSP